MKFTSFTLILAVSGLLSSCKVHFTESIRTRIESSDDQAMEKVQFYNDQPIRLVYKSTSSNDAVKSGKVKFENGFYHYQIDIPKNTKAIAKESAQGELQIQFEDGSEKVMLFRYSNHENEEIYELQVAQAKNGEFVKYDGKTMQLLRGSEAQLLIKKSLRKANEKERRKLKGVRVK